MNQIQVLESKLPSLPKKQFYAVKAKIISLKREQDRKVKLINRYNWLAQ